MFGFREGERKLVLFVLWFLLFFWFGIEGTSSACLYLILYLLFVCQESDKNLVVYYLLFGFLVWKRSFIYCLVALKMEEIKANWNFEVLSLQKEEKFNKIWGVLNFVFCSREQNCCISWVRYCFPFLVISKLIRVFYYNMLGSWVLG